MSDFCIRRTFRIFQDRRRLVLDHPDFGFQLALDLFAGFSQRGLDKALFQELLTGKWIADKRNLILTGPCGVGKTWLACALAQAACRTGVTVLYRRLPRLFDELELATATAVSRASFEASPRRSC